MWENYHLRDISVLYEYDTVEYIIQIYSYFLKALSRKLQRRCALYYAANEEKVNCDL